MAKRKRDRKKPVAESPPQTPDATPGPATKESVEGFLGGANLPLDQEYEDGKTLREVLTDHIDETLDLEIQNRAQRIEDIEKWQRQFSGWREAKSSPFYRAANTALPLSRAAADTLYVRMSDTLYGRDKIVLVKPVTPESTDIAFKIEAGLEYYLRKKLDFKYVMQDPLMQSVKAGAGFVFIDWVDEKRTVTRYATEKELKDDDIPKLKTDGDPVVQVVRSLYRGPKVKGIPAEDWICSSEADNVDDAYIAGFRFYARDQQVKARVKQGVYDKPAVDKLMFGDDYDDVKKNRAEMRGKEIEKTEYEQPYELWRLWLWFDVNKDDEEDSIEVVYHRASKQLLRAIYNPLFSKFRPLEPIVFYPLEYSLEGEGVCEILYKLQIEIDTLHNQRIDRMTEINAPLIFVRAGIGLDDYKINPGEVTPVDEDLESSIRIENFPDVYYSTMQEEDRISTWARLAVGIAEENQGQTSAERPVFKEAFARLQETNKKFQSGRDNVIRGYTRIIEKMLEFFGQYSPEYTYVAKDKDQHGRTIHVNRTVDFPMEILWEGIQVEMVAATEIMNPDSRREMAITVYHMLSDYMTKNAGVVEAIMSQEVPSDFKRYLISQYEIGITLIRRIMEDFDQADPESLAVSLDEVIDVAAAIQNSIDLMPPPPPQPPEQMGPEGGVNGGQQQQVPQPGGDAGVQPGGPPGQPVPVAG